MLLSVIYTGHILNFVPTVLNCFSYDVPLLIKEESELNCVHLPR
jgi:hypothetical protein